MRSNARQRKIRSDFSLGGEQAEADWLLSEAFYETGLFRGIRSRDQKKCFLVGRTGSGKSACLQMLEAQHPDHVIRISPEDLSLPYITDLGAVKYLSALEVHLDPLFIALWKHVLITEIIKHRYHVDSQDAKQRIMSMLKEMVKRDRSKRAALDYLEDFEGKFWVETDQRVREITTNFERQINAEASIPTGVPDLALGFSASSTKSQAERTELRLRYQKIVNSTQLPRLNKMVSVLNDDILDPQNFTYVVIDDLDRDWADEKISNDLIRCLFRAVNDLKQVQNLKILVALRTNIFESLDFGRTGGQEEKFRSLIARMTWTKSDLKELLDARAVLAAKRHGVDGISGVDDLLPKTNDTRGSGVNYILNRTLMRPRDAIAFFNECFPLANSKDRLTWAAIKSAETSYSINRLLALRDEWKPTFPGIDQVLRVFKGAANTLSPSEMCTRLDICALLAVEKGFPGTVWMTPLSEPLWSGTSSDDWAVNYLPLIRLLHNIGFIGCITTSGKYDEPAIFNHDQPAFTDLPSNLRKVTGFVIHPAFRPALDIPG
ncbi:hypothetical protein U2F26_34680 [Micromonospora sp. 4G57]|uniref:Uncharacterized protein n=1 Tax=Micromonospora sicca TaxID=2202420 RepID=A0ABU5JPF9_9ACTN|nr:MULTISPECIES: hypothetical protein [unclassified Micromonospora]MDZ5447791.1 hypothetical protein [Micromonospora sp. 4G57]MDZ5494517.1 hypothetical protein [Micromonospora sp. 4G53]